MAANFDDTKDSRRSSYMVALLALWAGDDESAEKLLRATTKGLSRKSRRELGAEDPIGASALRTLDQLRRRKTEFERLAAATNATLDAEDGELLNESRKAWVLRSAGGHLKGVVWIESEREYEFRVYLKSLEWEQDFYRQTAKRAAQFSETRSVDLSPYVTKGQVDEKQGKSRTASILDRSWFEAGAVLMRSQVSDFCTVQVRAVWTEISLPTGSQELEKQFQSYLDALDPPTKQNVDWSKEGF